MIRPEALLCFAVWLAYGIVQMRRSHLIRASVGRIPRTRRVLLGAGAMLGGVMLFFAFLALLPSLGLVVQGRILPGGWLLAALVGLAFVHAQTVGMAMLISLAYESVTSEQAGTSVPKESDPSDRS